MTANDWRTRAGRSILDAEDPAGQPLDTPPDRRWLWRIEGILAVSATSDAQRQLARDLRQYLAETCEHHWIPYAESHWGDPDTGVVRNVIPAHRQCLWCSVVDWADEAVPLP